MTYNLPKAPPRNKVKIDKSELADGIEQRYEDRAYLDACHAMECVVTGTKPSEFLEEGIDPCHIRAGWFGQSKPHDFWVLTKIHSEHRKEELGETLYWLNTVQANPFVLVQALKGWATLRYIKWLLGSPDMTDLALVKKIKEARQRGWL